eukprot:381060-Pyramimonas_sp.AAC.1
MCIRDRALAWRRGSGSGVCKFRNLLPLVLPQPSPGHPHHHSRHRHAPSHGVTKRVRGVPR